jgi:hypothetical protein
MGIKAKSIMTRGGVPLTAEDWKAGRIDPKSLPPQLVPLYAKIAAAQDAANKASAAFHAEAEKVLASKIAAGRKLFVSHRFGRLVMLTVDGNTAPIGNELFGAG